MSAPRHNRKPRLVPAILIGIGAFLLTLALMMVFVVVPSKHKTPLSLYSTSVTEEAPANLLIAGAFAHGEPTPGNADRPECHKAPPEAEHREDEGHEGEGPQPEQPEAPAELPMSCFIERGMPLIAHRQVQAVEPGDKNVVTLQAAQAILRTDKLDEGDGSAALVNASLDRITTDRKTGEPVDGNNGSIELVPQDVTGEAPAEFHRDGIQYKFPFSPKKQDYPYFDYNTMTTNPIHFVEESDVDGAPVYVFEQKLGPINMFEALSDYFQRTSPGFSQTAKTVLASYRMESTAGRWGLEGDPQRKVKMQRFYTNDRMIKVSKTTGQILSGEESQMQFFAEDQGAADAFWNDKAKVDEERHNPTRTAFSYTGTWNQETIDHAVARTKEVEGTLNTLGRIVPISMGIIGLLFILGGVMMSRRRA